MFTLSASFRNIRSKLNECNTDDNVKQRLFQHFSASFRNIPSKLRESWWWQTFFCCKSMEPCCCHSNQGSHWISMKSLCNQSPTRGMQQMRNDWDQPADCGDITGQRCWQTTNRPLSYKLPWSLRPRWAKNLSTQCGMGLNTVIRYLKLLTLYVSSNTVDSCYLDFTYLE